MSIVGASIVIGAVLAAVIALAVAILAALGIYR